ncbi:MAG: glycosyltransferase family 9 protein [Coriobacteriia bacterium]|nr:glycosyltransferase family 9 protein [Coriobacteriia bacterium]
MWREPFSAARRVLAVRLDNIGDVVMLGPALRAVKAAGAAHLTLLCSPAGAQAAPLLPWVDDVLVARVSWQDVSGRLADDASGDKRLIRHVSAGRYDAAIVFTSFSQSPLPPAYACYLAGIPVRAAHSREFAGAVVTHPVTPPADETHQVERNLDLLRGLGLAAPSRPLEVRVPPEARRRARALLDERGIGGGFVAAAPGAGCSARRYPATSFAEAVRLIAAGGRGVAVVGSERESELVGKVAGATPGAAPVAGETGVPELAALLAEASAVVANDSAALHLADAVGTPVVAVFSGTDLPGQWAPRSVPSAVLTRETACSPCYAYECPRDKACLAIPPAEVAEEAARLAAAGEARGRATGRAPREDAAAATTV